MKRAEKETSVKRGIVANLATLGLTVGTVGTVVKVLLATEAKWGHRAQKVRKLKNNHLIKKNVLRSHRCQRRNWSSRKKRLERIRRRQR